MPLTVHKCRYSALPWRILLRTEGKGLRTEQTDLESSSVLSPQHAVLELPDSGCATQRDALALLARLEAVGDWDAFATWPRAQHQAAVDILQTTAMAQTRQAILARGREAWQE